MLSRLAGRRALLASAICALAAALGGCATTAATTATVPGNTLTVYASGPPLGAVDDRAQDVLAAEQLALQQAGGRVGDFKLKLIVLHGAKVSDNARTAIRDTSTIAYLGEVVPGQSADSLGIVGDLGILQISPTDTAVELTQHSGAVAGSPNVYIEASTNSQRTFARVVPTTAQEAGALVSDLRGLHAAKLYLTDDGGPYGAALAAEAFRQARAAGLPVEQGAPTAGAFAASGADALLYATANKNAAAALFNATAQRMPSAKLLAPSALDAQSFASALSPAAQRAIQVSAPGFLPPDLTAAGRQFVASFRSTYSHAPSPQAIFGYEAMSALLSVLQRAGSGAANRSTVLHDFFAIRNRPSVLGTYSIDSNGDTSLAPFVISHVRTGRLVPYRFVSEQG